MKGDFYIQRELDGSLIEKPLKINGSISLKDRKLSGFNIQDYFVIEMWVMDFTISADGIMFMGTEETRNGTKTYQEIWFVPKR